LRQKDFPHRGRIREVSTKATGTGLGLSIAARIVETHGGSIRYQTKVGSGTTFSITLPGAEKSKHET
jgi:signal transduction histidine kinase